MKKQKSLYFTSSGWFQHYQKLHVKERKSKKEEIEGIPTSFVRRNLSQGEKKIKIKKILDGSTSGKGRIPGQKRTTDQNFHCP